MSMVMAPPTRASARRPWKRFHSPKATKPTRDTDSSALHRLLRSLSRSDRRLFAAAFIACRSTSKIAAELEISPDAARKRISRLRDRVRREWTAEDVRSFFRVLARARAASPRGAARLEASE
jgi:DNA-directed RNA polymerase specialized sigma24 family protein